MDSALQQMFAEQKVNKTYHAIVRGYTKTEELISYPLKKEWDKKEKKRNKAAVFQESITSLKTINQVEVPIPSKGYSSPRFSSPHSSAFTSVTVALIWSVNSPHSSSSTNSVLCDRLINDQHLVAIVYPQFLMSCPEACLHVPRGSCLFGPPDSTAI